MSDRPADETEPERSDAENASDLREAVFEHGTIAGTVTDGNDDPVGNAEITVTVEGEGWFEAWTVTDDDGDYTVDVEGDDVYVVVAEYPGFAAGRAEGVAVVTGNTTTADVTITRRPYRVRGESSGHADVGVLGRTTALTGVTKGVLGISDSWYEGSTGVRGVALSDATYANTIGVEGLSESNYGIGVRGEGSAWGVRGISSSGDGVSGVATHESGEAYGVRGDTESRDGRGVAGTAYTPLGGDSWSNGNPMGLYGATDWSGANDGVYAGYGVYAVAKALSGTCYGVYGETYSPDGFAVYGESSTDDGSVAIEGVTDDSYETRNGTSYGVRGVTHSTGTDSTGVWGEAALGSGITYGVYGKNNSLDTPAAAVYADGGLQVTHTTTGDPIYYRKDHAAFVEDRQSENSSVLSLQVGDDSPDPSDNFVTFIDGSNSPIASIEGDGSGGVNFQSTGADYAEYVPRLDPGEAIEPADVVGVVDGAVTRRTTDADQVQVVSDRSIVTGNAPGDRPDDRAGYETVAFVGQVPVKVRGHVDAGDLVVPSGEDDGTGRAVAPEDWTPGEGPIVGRAREAATDPKNEDDLGDGETDVDDRRATDGRADRNDRGGASGGGDCVSRVTVAVGIETGDALAPVLARQRSRIAGLERTVEAVTAENEGLRERLAGLEDRVGRLEGGPAAPASADD